MPSSSSMVRYGTSTYVCGFSRKLKFSPVRKQAFFFLMSVKNLNVHTLRLSNYRNYSYILTVSDMT